MSIFLENYIRHYDIATPHLMKKDKERHVDGVFRCIKDEWLEKQNVETKDWNDWKLIETNDWNDWKLINHRAETTLQPNSKLFILCYFLSIVRLIVIF